MHIIFKNCHLVDPVTNCDITNTSIEIKDGIIIAIGAISDASDATVFDLNGKIVAPGFFDMHVHLREPGQEYKETIATGTLAAAYGGFTGICCMPNTDPPISDQFVVSFIKAKAANNAVDVEICGTMTKERKGESLASLGALKDAGVKMISDDGSAVMNAEVMRRVFEYAKMFDLLCTQHCEEHSMTKGTCMHEGKISAKLGLPGYPSVAEDLIVARDIMLAEFVGEVRYHAAHLSTKESVELVRQAKLKGLPVTCEVTPHHFTLTDEAVEQYWCNAKMNPPLREQEDIDAIIVGLVDGTIDCIASDHAPHAEHEKETDMLSAAYGIIGLETSIGLGVTQLVRPAKLSLMEYIRKCSTNPRKILGVDEIRIEIGAVANLTIFDTTTSWALQTNSIHSKSKNTPFISRSFYGKPWGIVNNSQTIGELFDK